MWPPETQALMIQRQDWPVVTKPQCFFKPVHTSSTMLCHKLHVNPPCKRVLYLLQWYTKFPPRYLHCKNSSWSAFLKLFYSCCCRPSSWTVPLRLLSPQAEATSYLWSSLLPSSCPLHLHEKHILLEFTSICGKRVDTARSAVHSSVPTSILLSG